MLHLVAVVATLAASLPAAAPAVTSHDSRYGKVLFDKRGHVVYLFTRERGRTPACYGACAKAWPPYLATRRPRGKRVGWTRRSDGRHQVTYAGHPLYYYVGDRRPGDILCHDVAEFGGTWLVIKPSGEPA